MSVAIFVTFMNNRVVIIYYEHSPIYTVLISSIPTYLSSQTYLLTIADIFITIYTQNRQLNQLKPKIKDEFDIYFFISIFVPKWRFLIKTESWFLNQVKANDMIDKPLRQWKHKSLDVETSKHSTKMGEKSNYYFSLIKDAMVRFFFSKIERNARREISWSIGFKKAIRRKHWCCFKHNI